MKFQFSLNLIQTERRFPRRTYSVCPIVCRVSYVLIRVMIKLLILHVLKIFDGKVVSALQKVSDISQKFSKRKNEIYHGTIINILILKFVNQVLMGYKTLCVLMVRWMWWDRWVVIYKVWAFQVWKTENLRWISRPKNGSKNCLVE